LSERLAATRRCLAIARTLTRLDAIPCPEAHKYPTRR
jgi:hypothetical protein